MLKNKASGRLELITAPLGDKVILDGVTRRSVLELARARLADELDVVERTYTMDELVAAHGEGRFVEAFAAGTAFFVAPVSDIHFRGTDIAPLKMGSADTYTARIKEWLVEIMYGKVAHEWGVVVDEEGFEAEAPAPAAVDAMVAKIKALKADRAWAAAYEKLRAAELGEDEA